MSNKTNNKKEENIESLYGKECTLSKEDFLKEYNIDMNGLSSIEAEKRLQQ